jgi:hypothetical protein
MSPDRGAYFRARYDLAAALACVILSMSPALAQDGGPIIVGEHEKLKTFALDNFDAAIEAFWRTQTDDSTPASGPKFRDTETLFRQILLLNTDGYIGHPNLVLLDLSARLQLSQEDINAESTGLNDQNNENITEYNLSALVLRRSKLPLTVYTRRAQTLLTRQFGSTLDNITTEYGARLDIKSDFAPNQIQVFRREQEQTGRFTGTDFLLTQDSVAWHGRLKPINGHRMWWDYTFSSVDQSGPLQAPNTFQRHDAFLNHTYDFGPEARNNLRSSLRFFKETGSFPIERLRWDESLQLRHTQKFETRYDLLYDQQTRRVTKQTLWRGAARFRHELYDSLTTTGQLGTSLLNITDTGFESTQLFGNLGMEYTKIVPLGTLLATANLSFNSQDDSERGSAILISREPHNFGISGLVTLNRRNIVASSIVITDSSGLILYTEGVDYTVRDFTENIEIRRVLGGAIASGQAVLITYDVGPEPASKTDTLGYGVTIRYRFEEGRLKGLSPYLRYRDQSQDRTGRGIGNLPVSDFQDLVLGVDYDIWRIGLSAEHQIHDSRISPFTLTRLTGRYSQRISRRDSLLVSAYYQSTNRTDENARNTVTNVTARWNTKVTERVRSSVVGTWRREEDNVGTSSDGFDLNIDLTWRYRQTLLYATIRNSVVNSTTRDNTSQTLLFGLRRDF